jgi:uncharacterized membrane protein YkgB
MPEGFFMIVATTTSNRLAKVPAVLVQVGQLVSRYGLVIVLAWIGFGKYVKMEARVLIEHSPLMSWIYDYLSVTTGSTIPRWAPPRTRRDTFKRSVAADPAPDSYGGLATARKSWWLTAAAMMLCMSVIGIYFAGSATVQPWLAVVSAAAMSIVATLRGYEDGSWAYPIARGQRLQLGVSTVITLGIFGVLYLGGFLMGRRWPRRSKRSLEYRANPRHHE